MMIDKESSDKKLNNQVDEVNISTEVNTKKKSSKKEKKEKKRKDERVKDIYAQVKKLKSEQEAEKEVELDDKDKVELNQEKEKKKKRAKSVKPQSKRDENQEQFKLQEAIAYLNQFINYKESWKFRKVIQIYILQNLYIEDKFDDKVFENILEYIKDSKGNSREMLLKEAKKIYEDEELIETTTEKDENNENKAETSQDKYTEKQKDRAFKIISLLS